MKAGSRYRPPVRRRAALLGLVVLPALAVRALLPVGFMPVIDDAGLHLGFCPGEAQPPGALLAGAHLAHQHHHGGAEHGTPASASHPPCLFALSAGPAFVPAAPALAPVPPAAAALTAGPSRAVLVPAIVRAQTARGPPASRLRR